MKIALATVYKRDNRGDSESPGVPGREKRSKKVSAPHCTCAETESEERRLLGYLD